MSRARLTEVVLQGVPDHLQGVDGASVQVNPRGGGGSSTVYQDETGIGTWGNPLTTRDGRIEPEEQEGGEAWLETGSYELAVSYGQFAYTASFEAVNGNEVGGLESDVLAASRSPNGHWHEVTVADDGRLGTVDIGAEPPHGPPPYATLAEVDSKAAKANLPLNLSDYVPADYWGTGLTDVGNRGDATVHINQAAVDAYAQKRKLEAGRGGYLLITDTVTFGDIDMDLSGVTLRANVSYPVGSHKPFVKLFQPGARYFNRVFQRSIKLPRIENGRAYQGADPTRSRWITDGGTNSVDNGDVGVQLVNVEGCEIFVPWVRHFSTGLEVAGVDDAGSAYSTITIGQLTHNRVNLLLSQLNTTGWSNSNTYLTGGFNHFNNEAQVRCPGVRHVVIAAPINDDANYQVNGNVWYGSSFEGPVTEFEIESWGASNACRDCRWERAGGTAPRVRYRSSGANIRGIDNIIDGSFNHHTIDLTQSDASAIRNIVRSPRAVRAFPDTGVADNYEGVAAQPILTVRQTGDAGPRIGLRPDGSIMFYPGTSGTPDAALQRTAAGQLTFGNAGSGSNIGIQVKRGFAGQTYAFFRAYDETNATLWQVMPDGAMLFVELAADSAAPSANQAKLYARDNGSGKTQLCARFPTGAVQVLATEP